MVKMVSAVLVIAAAGLAALPAHAESEPTCARPPATGQKLAGDLTMVPEGHRIEISNAGQNDALLKLRYTGSRKLAATYFIHAAETLELEGVPDGSYIMQYAVGPALAADCRSLTHVVRAAQLPGADNLRTETVDDDQHTEVKRQTISYALFAKEGGNVQPVDITSAQFNAN